MARRTKVQKRTMAKPSLFLVVLVFVSLAGSIDPQSRIGNQAFGQQSDFQFRDFQALEDMSEFLVSRFDSSSTRTDLRRLFVDQGEATLVKHPSKPDVEKYIYDINLCRYYIWRWNISADYSGDGTLLRLFLNGESIFPSGLTSEDPLQPAAEGEKAVIIRGQRPRPEADKGESSLGFILYDADSDTTTIDDQLLIGAGPSRADPINMGKMRVYKSVEPWRSIFDFDEATQIVDYDGDCAAVDQFYRSGKSG